MGHVRRVTYTKPLPEGAELFTRKRQRYARWTTTAGKSRTAKVTETSAGVLRILEQSRMFTAFYRDADGRATHAATGCTSAEGARAKLREIERREEQIRQGLLSADERETVTHITRPIGEHLEAYRGYHEACQHSAKHVAELFRVLGNVLDACGFRTLRDIEREGVERYLVRRERANVSAQTRKSERAALVAFCKWCVETRRLGENPVARVPVPKVRQDERRHVRRALTEAELEALLCATLERPMREMMTVRRGERKGEAIGELRPETRRLCVARGLERYLIYKTLFLTGLRVSELRAIRFRDIDLDSDAPTLHLPAGAEKARRGAAIPLRADLVEELRQWPEWRLLTARKAAQRAGKPAPGLGPDLPLFLVSSELDAVLYKDLTAAGIEREDARGRKFGLHAFRMTADTYLQRNSCGTRPRR